ncbi:hypothetical protein [Limosilactobacillus reuteri]|uniref:hypothetical protein n=1 Tax=Limosilactobacillus reuteri TaxID=1598 RepID=UPI001CDC6E37|nr:hypothetical protein [Limosilactobacillus reuteri]
MNYQKISEDLTFLMSDKRITIVHGVLKSLGISPRQDDYDDFVQDASIIFAQAYADFLQEKDEVENERDLMCFAYQRMRWRLLDRLRRQQLECFLFNYTLDNEEDDHDYDETMTRQWLITQQLLHLLTWKIAIFLTTSTTTVPTFNNNI